MAGGRHGKWRIAEAFRLCGRPGSGELAYGVRRLDAALDEATQRCRAVRAPIQSGVEPPHSKQRKVAVGHQSKAPAPAFARPKSTHCTMRARHSSSSGGTRAMPAKQFAT